MEVWVKCPGCGAQIQASATSCAMCLRPRSRPEIMRGIIELQQAPNRRRRVFLRSAAVVGLCVIAAAMVWDGRENLRRKLQPFKSFAVTWLGLDQYPFKTEAAPAPAGPDPAAPAPAPAAEAPSLVAAAPAAAALPDDIHISTISASGQPAPPAHWALRGRVYNLYTLKPVAKAALTFTSRVTGKSLLSRTDGSGDFTLRLPRISEGGYDIAVSHPRYLDSWIEENDPPYRTMDLDRRQRAGALLLQSEVLHVPYLPLPDEERPQLDLVLLPR